MSKDYSKTIFNKMQVDIIDYGFAIVLPNTKEDEQ